MQSNCYEHAAHLFLETKHSSIRIGESKPTRTIDTDFAAYVLDVTDD